MSNLDYNSISDIVEEELKKKRYKWNLWNLEWDDVAQIIRNRIHLKIHLFNSEKGTIRQWLKVVISSTMKNILRDNYGKYARPCVLGGGGLACAFNMGGDRCAYTKSGTQCAECPLFAKWQAKKKNHHDIKQTLSLENHLNEVQSLEDETPEINGAKAYLDTHIRQKLNAKEYKFYVLMFVKNKTEEEISKKMNYTSSEKRLPGYSNMAAMKRKIVVISRELLKEGGFC